MQGFSWVLPKRGGANRPVPRGAAIFFEFKHYKPKKKKVSTRTRPRGRASGFQKNPAPTSRETRPLCAWKGISHTIEPGFVFLWQAHGKQRTPLFARALSWKQLASPTQPPCCLPQERQYGLCLKVFRVTYPKHLREKLIDYPPTSFLGSAQTPVETPLSSWRVPLFAFHVSWCYRLPQTYGYRESTRSQNAEISSKGVGLSWSWPS